jgi:hypothetical protein
MGFPSARSLFVFLCVATVVTSLGSVGWVVMGSQPVDGDAVLAAPEPEPEPAAQPCVQTVADLALPPGTAADDPRLQGAHLIVVRKAKRRLTLFAQGKAVVLDGTPACWRVGLGPAPRGHKYRQGDGRTPEGWYRTSDKPWSQYYGAIAIHYPNAHDAEAGRVQGTIDAPTARAMQAALKRDRKPAQQTDLGGEILIHGEGSATDWTLGCVAMDNPDLDQLRAALPKGLKTDVLILP